VKKCVNGLAAQRDQVIAGNKSQLLSTVAQYALPAIWGLREFAEAGGLMSYGPDFVDLYRRCAHMVDRVLRGATPADMPVEQPTRFELVINLKTAKALGLTVPQSLLARADEVIE